VSCYLMFNLLFLENNKQTAVSRVGKKLFFFFLFFVFYFSFFLGFLGLHVLLCFTHMPALVLLFFFFLLKEEVVWYVGYAVLQRKASGEKYNVFFCVFPFFFAYFCVFFLVYFDVSIYICTYYWVFFFCFCFFYFLWEVIKLIWY